MDGQTYQTRWGVIQFHLGGPGLSAFAEAANRSVERSTENGVKIHCLCTRDLLESKPRQAGPVTARAPSIPWIRPCGNSNRPCPAQA